MNWEKKLNGLSYLSLKSKTDGVSSAYVKLEDARKVSEAAWNEALETIKEIYKDDKDVIDTIKDLLL